MPLCQIQESFSGQLFPLNCCGTIQRAVVTLLQPLESQLEEKSFWRKHTIEGQVSGGAWHRLRGAQALDYCRFQGSHTCRWTRLGVSGSSRPYALIQPVPSTEAPCCAAHPVTNTEQESSRPDLLGSATDTKLYSVCR